MLFIIVKLALYTSLLLLNDYQQLHTIDGVITVSQVQNINEREATLSIQLINYGVWCVSAQTADYFLKTKAEFVDQPTINPLARSPPSLPTTFTRPRPRVVWSYAEFSDAQ